MVPALIVHGGAGNLPETHRDAIAAGCAAAAQAGWRILRGGGAALDAVCAAVSCLEDNALFNAGVGSVLTADGTVEMDASIMDGHGLRAGAAALLRRVRNPVLLARAVLEDGQHVLLAADGAERFASERGLLLCAEETFMTVAQRQRWARYGTGDTVGAVAIDREGHLAAATSTGGRFRKRSGRIGDSAIIGAGTYAADFAGAISVTGNGDAILRVGLARSVAVGMQSGSAPEVAVQAQLEQLTRYTGAAAGVIALDRLGRSAIAHNTPYMSSAWIDASRAAPEVVA